MTGADLIILLVATAVIVLPGWVAVEIGNHKNKKSRQSKEEKEHE